MNADDMTNFIRKYYSNEMFNAEMDTNTEFLRKYFKDPHTSFQPMLVLVTHKREHIPMLIADLPEDSEQRHKMFHDIMQKVGIDEEFRKKHGFVIALFLMTEAWVRGQAFKGEKISLPISKNPMKSEVIICTGMTVDKRTNMSMYPMLRGDHNIVILDEKNISKSPYKEGDNSMMSFILYKAFAGYTKGMTEKI